MNSEAQELAYNALSIEQKAIRNVTFCIQTDSFAKAVDALSKASRVMTCASGTSGIAAKKFAHSLCCIELGATFMSPCEAIHGGLGALKSNDVLVIVSRGGKTIELFPIADICTKIGAVLIVVTENIESPLAQKADIVLPLKIEQEADKYNIMATASFISTVALFDALLVAVMEETNYQKAQFALIHPGGAVGEMFKESNHV